MSETCKARLVIIYPASAMTSIALNAPDRSMAASKVEGRQCPKLFKVYVITAGPMLLQQWVNLQDHRQVECRPCDHATAFGQGRDEGFGAGIQGADGVVEQHEVALVHQPVYEEIVDLGNDGGRNVGWSLTGESEVDPILAPLLDDFLKEFKPVVLPNFMLTGGLL